MSKAKVTYTVYHYEKFFGEGTAKEMAETTGLDVKYIKWLATEYGNSYRKWSVDSVNHYTKPNPRTLEEIKTLARRRGMYIKDLALAIGVNIGGLQKKVHGDVPFHLDELNKIEKFFSLEEGTLQGGNI